MQPNDFTSNHIAWNLQAKLRIPKYAVELVQRHALLNSLDGEFKPTTQLCLFVAPAGFSKTTSMVQLAQTLQQQQHNLAWLRLDSSDRDPKRFLSSVIYSLAAADLDMPELELAAKQGALDAPNHVIVAAILAHLNESLTSTHRFFLILDDYHLAECDALNQCIELLLQGNTGKLCLIVASRFKPSLKLSALRLNGQLLEVGEESLKFDQTELALLFGDSLNTAQQSQLFEKTQGWPAVLQLAKIWGQPEQLEHFNGGTEDLTDYITEQVITDLNADEKQFLLDTSILDQVHPEIADYIRASNDSHYYCRSLLRLAPLIGNEQAGQWISYHPLLQEYLRQDLQYKNRERWLQNCRRAAEWCSLNDDISNAIRFNCLAGDYQQAQLIFSQWGGWQISTRLGHQLMSELLSFFPSSWIEQNPTLALFQAYILVKQAKLAPARLLFQKVIHKQSIDLNTLDLLEADSLETASELGLMSLILKLYEDAETNEHTLTAIERAEQSHVGEFDTLAILLSGKYICQFNLGQLEIARQNALNTIQTLQNYELPYAQHFFYYHLSLSHFWLNDFEESRANIEYGIQFAADNFGSLSNLTAVGQVLLSQSYYYSNQLARSNDLLEHSLATVSEGDGWHGIFVPAYSTAIRCAYYSQGKPSDGLAAAKQYWQQGVGTARHRSLSRLEDYLDYIYIELLCDANELDLAKELLSSKNLDHYPSAFHWQNHALCCFSFCRYYLLRKDDQKAQYYLDQWKNFHSDKLNIEAKLYQIQHSLWQAILDFNQAEGPAAQESICRNLNLCLKTALNPFNLRLVLDVGKLVKPLLHTCASQAKQQALSSRYCQLLKMCIDNLNPSNSEQDLFSSRELEVLQSLAQGNANKLIARQLDMTENTVKFHLKRIYKKLNVEKRVAAVNEANRLKLL